MLTPVSEELDIRDIAIIGGGVAGTYTGYRLLSAVPADNPVLSSILERSGRDRLDIALFEWEGRIGGRLWSVEMPGLPNVPAEVGGMRFLESMQNVFGLSSKELQLDVTPFGFKDNIQYLRRHRFDFTGYGDPEQVPYFLADKEVGKSWMELVKMAVQEIVPDYAKYSGKDQIDYLRNARVSQHGLYDKPLYEAGFWHLLSNRLSIEAYHLIVDASGYYSIYDNCNAYIAVLDYMRNYENQAYHGIGTGYQTIPKTLAKRFEEKGGTIQLQSRLLRLDRENRNGEDLIRLQIGTPEGTEATEHYARHVVLAMPKRGLDLLHPDSFIFDNQQFCQDMHTVVPQHSSKVFLSFSEPWWQKLSPPITTGRSDSDLPFRQCYYFGTENEGPFAGSSLMMASYNDGIADTYWDTYLARSRFGPDQPYVGTHGNGPNPELLAPHELVTEIHRQLSETHGVDVPMPTHAIFHSWAEDPSGGGWYFWNPGDRSWEIAPRIRKPIDGCNLYVTGSCYSELQGWVEGALNSTDMMLMTYFGLSRPPWVSADYYMGP